MTRKAYFITGISVAFFLKHTIYLIYILLSIQNINDSKASCKNTTSQHKGFSSARVISQNQGLWLYFHLLYTYSFKIAEVECWQISQAYVSSLYYGLYNYMSCQSTCRSFQTSLNIQQRDGLKHWQADKLSEPCSKTTLFHKNHISSYGTLFFSPAFFGSSILHFY